MAAPKSIFIVKPLTGGMDLDSPLQQIKKEQIIDAQNVSLSNFKRRRGDLIPSIGVNLVNYSLETYVNGETLDDAIARWEALEPLISYSFFFPDMVFLGGTVKDKDYVVLYAIEVEKSFHQRMVTDEHDGLKYRIYELYLFTKEEFPISHKTAVEGFTDNGRHTVILTSHQLDLTFIQLNPEEIGMSVMSRMSDNAYSDTQIEIEDIYHSPSCVIPSVTVYTARVQTEHGVFSSFVRPSEPISIPYAYPEGNYKDRHEYKYEELLTGDVFSHVQVKLSIFLDNFKGGKHVYVYAIRFRSSLINNVPDLTPIIQEIAYAPFPTDTNRLTVIDGKSYTPRGETLTWASIAGKLNYYNCFRAAALCTKRNVLFAGNIIDEKEERDTYYDARVFQFNKKQKALDECLNEYTLDQLSDYVYDQTESMEFFQNSTVSYNGEDMMQYHDTDKYCVLNIYGQHGASGKNIDIVFAVGEQIDGEAYPQALDLANLHKAALLDESFDSPESRFSAIAIGLSNPSHGDEVAKSSAWQQYTIDGRVDEKEYLIQTEVDSNGNRGSTVATLQIGGHTHKNPCFNARFKSMQHDSVYRLGLMFIYEDFTCSEMFNMGEIRTPSMNNPLYRLSDSSTPLGVNDKVPATHVKYIQDPADSSKQIEAYKLAICNELTMYPLYMHITVRNLPYGVSAVRIYYGDRLTHDARNVEQTGVFTKLLPPLRKLTWWDKDKNQRRSVPQYNREFMPKYPFKEYYYDRQIYTLPPLPFVATQRHFYGGIIDCVHPNDRRQACINVPDGIDYTTNQSEDWTKSWKNDEGWCNFFVGRPLQLCDIEAAKPNPEALEMEMPEMYAFYAPETDLRSKQGIPFSVVNNRQGEDYAFQTHGFLTSLMPAGEQRGFLSAVYSEPNDSFNHFFSLRHKKACPPYDQDTDQQSYYDMDVFRNTYPYHDFSKVGDQDVRLDPDNPDSEKIKIPRYGVFDHSAWPTEYNCTYDSLYQHNFFSPTLRVYNPHCKEMNDKGWPKGRESFSCLMSTLVSQEGLEHNSGKFWTSWWQLWGQKSYTKAVDLGKPIGTGAARRTLKYYISWDTYIQTGEPTKELSMRNKKIEPSDIMQIKPGITDFNNQFAFLFPCSYQSINTERTTADLLDPVQIDRYLFCNVSPVYAGKIIPDKKIDFLLNDLAPYEKNFDKKVMADLLVQAKDIVSTKDFGGIKWVQEGTAFHTALHCYSSPRLFNNFMIFGDWAATSETSVRMHMMNNTAWDAGLIPFAEHGQAATNHHERFSMTNYYSTALVRRKDTIWYPGKGGKSRNSLTSSCDLEFTSYEEEFMLFKPEQMPRTDHLLFPSVTWCDWPNAYGVTTCEGNHKDNARIQLWWNMYSHVIGNIGGHRTWLKDALLSLTALGLFYVAWERLSDDGLTQTATNHLGEKNETITGIKFTCDYFTGLNHHGWGGSGVIFTVPPLSGLPYSYYGDKFQVPVETKEFTTEPTKDSNGNNVAGGKTHVHFLFKDTFSPEIRYTDYKHVTSEQVDYSSIKSGGTYFMLDPNGPSAQNPPYIKGAEHDSMKIVIEDPENTTYIFNDIIEDAPVCVAEMTGPVDSPYNSKNPIIKALHGQKLLDEIKVTYDTEPDPKKGTKGKGAKYANKVYYTQYYKMRAQGFFWAYFSRLINPPKVWQVIDRIDASTIKSRCRVAVSDYREYGPYTKYVWDGTKEHEIIRENMAWREVDINYLQESLSNGSHVIFSTLRRKNKIPFQDVPVNETQWCRATEIPVAEGAGKVSGFVTGFDCYTGIYRRPYMNAFYPDGKQNVIERANACSSPTVMCFPYEGMVNVEIEDPVRPLAYPAYKEQYSNPRSFHSKGDFYIKTDPANVLGAIYDPPILRKQELPAWDYQMAWSNYQWKDKGVGVGYDDQDMRHHPNRVLYSRFNYDDGTFGPFEMSGTKTLDLEPIYGDVHQIINYKNSIIILQDRCVTTALPDLPVLLQDANRAKIEAGQPATSASGVVIGSSEIFTMKGQPTSLYGCSQDGATAYYATADHIYWFDHYRECACIFTAEGVKNLSVGTHTSSWARQVARLVREDKGYVTLYENRDSTLRIAYHGDESIMEDDFPFQRNAKRQVIELCEKTMAFSSFISANYDVAAKIHGGNLFFHRDETNNMIYVLEEGIFNGFYMPQSEQGDLYVTCAMTPDLERQSEMSFASVLIHNTDHFIQDYVVEATLVQGNYFKGSKLFTGNMFNSGQADQFGAYYNMGLPKGSKHDTAKWWEDTMTFKGSTIILGFRFTSFTPVSTGVDGKKFEDWNLGKMKNYYINSFKLGVETDMTNL